MVIRFTLAIALCVPAVAQEWTNRAEYDLVLDLRAESDPARRLALLNEWKKQYPASKNARVRAEMSLGAAEAMNDPAQIRSFAKELLAADPNAFAGLYWTTLLGPQARSASPAELSATADAAKRLLLNSAAFFNANKAGPGTRESAEWLAHRTLGWVAWQRGAYDEAATEFQRCLQKTPADGEIAAWLGSVLALQDTPVKSIWYLARASYLQGDGALSGQNARQVRDLLEGLYVRYHGSLDSLEAIGQGARVAAAMPADFRIESAAELTLRKRDEELLRTNPDLAPWLTLKRRLEAADGEAHFQTLMTTPLRLKGLVLECRFQAPATEVDVALDDPAAAGVTLTLDTAFAVCAPSGTPIEFEALPQTMSKSPFKLGMKTTRDKVTGWPEPPAKKR